MAGNAAKAATAVDSTLICQVVEDASLKSKKQLTVRQDSRTSKKQSKPNKPGRQRSFVAPSSDLDHPGYASCPPKICEVPYNSANGRFSIEMKSLCLQLSAKSCMVPDEHAAVAGLPRVSTDRLAIAAGCSAKLTRNNSWCVCCVTTMTRVGHCG